MMATNSQELKARILSNVEDIFFIHDDGEEEVDDLQDTYDELVEMLRIEFYLYANR